MADPGQAAELISGLLTLPLEAVFPASASHFA